MGGVFGGGWGWGGGGGLSCGKTGLTGKNNNEGHMRRDNKGFLKWVTSRKPGRDNEGLLEM